MKDDLERRVLSLIGLGARAGRLGIGVEASHAALRRGTAEALIMPINPPPTRPMIRQLTHPIAAPAPPTPTTASKARPSPTCSFATR